VREVQLEASEGAPVVNGQAPELWCVVPGEAAPGQALAVQKQHLKGWELHTNTTSKLVRDTLRCHCGTDIAYCLYTTALPPPLPTITHT